MALGSGKAGGRETDADDDGVALWHWSCYTLYAFCVQK